MRGYDRCWHQGDRGWWRRGHFRQHIRVARNAGKPAPQPASPTAVRISQLSMGVSTTGGGLVEGSVAATGLFWLRAVMTSVGLAAGWVVRAWLFWLWMVPASAVIVPAEFGVGLVGA